MPLEGGMGGLRTERALGRTMIWLLLGCAHKAPTPPAVVDVPAVHEAWVFVEDLPANTVLDLSHVELERYPEALRSPHWPPLDDAMGKVLTTSVARGMPVDARRLTDAALPTLDVPIAEDAPIRRDDIVRFVQAEGSVSADYRVLDRMDEGLVLADEGQGPPSGRPMLVGRRRDDLVHGPVEPLWPGCVSDEPEDRSGWVAVARAALVPRLGLDAERIMHCPGELYADDPEGPELAVVRPLFPGEPLAHGVMDVEGAFPPPAALRLSSDSLAVSVHITDFALLGLHYDVLADDQVVQTLKCVGGWVGGGTLLEVSSEEASVLLFAEEPLRSAHRDDDDLEPQPEDEVRARILYLDQ